MEPEMTPMREKTWAYSLLLAVLAAPTQATEVCQAAWGGAWPTARAEDQAR
jgi:hypothetical protein